MNVLDMCRRRWSVRSFTGDPVDTKDLEYLMEAARWAATSGNRQARRFVLLRDAERIGELVQCASMQDFVRDAGVLIFGIAAERSKPGARSDVIISLAQLEMAAVERGLGTIWLGMWESEAVRQYLQVPEDMEPVVALAVGHAGERGAPRDKLSTEELFMYDRM